MSVAELSIPQGWEAISAEWMTAALAGHFPGATVSDVAVVLRDDGTNRRARLALTYSAGDGPATVFAKAVDPEHADLVALTSGLYHAEVPLDGRAYPLRDLLGEPGIPLGDLWLVRPVAVHALPVLLDPPTHEYGTFRKRECHIRR